MEEIQHRGASELWGSYWRGNIIESLLEINDIISLENHYCLHNGAVIFKSYLLLLRVLYGRLVWMAEGNVKEVYVCIFFKCASRMIITFLIDRKVGFFHLLLFFFLFSFYVLPKKPRALYKKTIKRMCKNLYKTKITVKCDPTIPAAVWLPEWIVP